MSIEFPGQGILPILASGWRQFLSHWYEVLVVWRKHGIIFLIYLIVDGTVIWIPSHFSRYVTQLLNALSSPEGRESDLYISFFARNGEEEIGQKEILWQRKVRKYFLDWFTPGKGPSIEFFGRSNITIQDNRQTDSFRGTQRQFSENICSEGDLRSRIFGTFLVKFLGSFCEYRSTDYVIQK